LSEKGYKVWICSEITKGTIYRDEIIGAAISCNYFIPFINEDWCKSKECEFESNIIIRTFCTSNNGFPKIIPIFLVPQNVYKNYKVAYAMACNFNAFTKTENDLGDSFWAEILESLTSKETKQLDPSVKL